MDKITKTTESFKDDRFWVAERGKDGNGFAVLRFLPAPEGEDVPWVRLFNHGFQGKGGGWFIENCPTTLGKKCPVCEANSELWNSGVESDKEVARQRKRKLSYISNILVVSDPNNRENEGKVFLYRYGKKIFEKIQEVMNPQYQDEKAINPFDFWAGAEFKLKIRQVDGYVNYDRSEFATPAPLLGGDDKALEELWKRQYALKEFTDPKNFKSYDELKARLHEVLGSDIRASVTESAAKGGAESASFDDDSPRAGRKPAMADAPAPKREAKQKVESDDTEDALSYFEKLAGDE
jgi:hypothetical protein